MHAGSVLDDLVNAMSTIAWSLVGALIASGGDDMKVGARRSERGEWSRGLTRTGSERAIHIEFVHAFGHSTASHRRSRLSVNDQRAEPSLTGHIVPLRMAYAVPPIVPTVAGAGGPFQ